MINGCVFDLDDTLYFERDHVKSGFRAAAKIVASKTNYSENALFAYLWESFKSGTRGNNFDKLIKQFPHISNFFDIEELVEIYRSHEPYIKLLPEALDLMLELYHNGFQIAVLTDGHLKTQIRKFKVLGLKDFVDCVIFTDAWGGEYWKPNNKGFVKISKKLNIPHNEFCYVGDNPEKDFFAPNSLGWYTIRFQHYKQLRYNLKPKSQEYSPHLTINNLNDLKRKVVSGVF